MGDGEASARFINQLRSLRGSRPPAPAEERCEFCARPLPDQHSHVVHVEKRNLLCACRPCYLLFTSQGAAGGKYRAVPERYLDLGERVLNPSQWDRLQVPVDLAFFFFNSSLGRTVAFYPSPAGATESLLSLATWEEIARANPRVASLIPDVEALLVWKRSEGCASYVVPIDACYELVGIVRRHWRGFHGGEEAWGAIAAFFAALSARSEPARSEANGG
ncbi:MAG TPA: DUF5947 family protein [Thermoanaerobaculia bacterium]|jgi:hypothetical protein